MQMVSYVCPFQVIRHILKFVNWLNRLALKSGIDGHPESPPASEYSTAF